ncbi:class E sortase [Kitasatospora sp. A2-31]|uniref:class E sortase n=1 Tax=Kitasatospora sp. A2-31 TaxID=2916414 RepID=UPI001EEBC581|nr:class E sortase [Kitasatospora sp. A2-31]MCG6498723.1 class E sortase [Kitasatospora sp. A2-31]MCG6499644.1 class E sortase [Kitasatospora sp. A2-31]
MPAMPALPTAFVLASVLAGAGLLAGCADDGGRAAGRPAAVSVPAAGSSAPVSPSGSAPVSPSVPAPAGTPTVPAAVSPSAPAAQPSPAAPSAPDTAAARSEAATLAIPSIHLAGLSVVPYQGTTDDGPGTRIQNRGVAASPYGEQGGVGPGEVGNYLVTAHRLSAGGPLRDLPSVREGDVVLVTVGGTEYEYVITGTRSTSFRSPGSLAEQRAAVPGRPGESAVQPMITISTCATPEDNAAGNRWRDANGNPEHRIDKIGVLRATRPAA